MFEAVLSLPRTYLFSLFLFVLKMTLTVILEWMSWDDVMKLRSRKGGEQLYWSALRANFVNFFFIASPTYYFYVDYLTPKDPLSGSERVFAAVGMMVIQSFIYYLVHKAYHEVKGLYWIHSYHHKFNTIVLPTSANAVSVAEFVTAYALPLVLAAMIVRADAVAVLFGSGIPSVANLFIHTPALENLEHYWPFVSTKDHFNHHRKLQTDYSAPIIHYDRIIKVVKAQIKA